MSAGPLADWAFEPVVLERELEALCARLLLRDGKPAKMRRACASVLAPLEASAGATLQERWTALETEHWRGWEQGVARLEPQRQWTWGPAALVLARAVRPGWELLSRARLSQWISWLPDEDPLKIETRWLRERIAGVEWACTTTGICSAFGSCCAAATGAWRRSPTPTCARYRAGSPRAWTRSTPCSAPRGSSTGRRCVARSADCAASD